MKTKCFLYACIITLNLAGYGQADTLVQISNVSIDSMGDIRWTVLQANDSKDLIQHIEQWKENKWVDIAIKQHGGKGSRPTIRKKTKGAVEASAKPKASSKERTCKDSVRVTFHKGNNRYRIRVSDPMRITTAEIILNSNMSNDDGSVRIINSQIQLKEKEYYEILDFGGAILSKGESKIISAAALPSGSYFLYTKKETKAFKR